MADEARGEQQAAATTLQQRRYLMLGTDKGAVQVGMQDIVPVTRFHVLQRHHRPDDPGIVEGDVEPAEALQCRGNQLLCQAFVAYIPGDGNGIASIAYDGFDQGVEFILAASTHNHLGAFTGKKTRCGMANARAGPGDDGDLSGKSFHSGILYGMDG